MELLGAAIAWDAVQATSLTLMVSYCCCCFIKHCGSFRHAL
jgi:hypothetical protein